MVADADRGRRHSPADKLPDCWRNRLWAALASIGGMGKILTTLAVMPRVLRLVWGAQPQYVVLLVALNALQGLQPLGEAWLGKQVIDTLTVAVMGGADPWGALPGVATLVALSAALAVAGAVITALSRWVWPQLGDEVMGEISGRILRKANSLKDLAFFESPKFYDVLLRAQNEVSDRPVAMISSLASVIRALLTACTMAAVLLTLHGALLPLVLITSLPTLVLSYKHATAQWWLEDWTVPEVRLMHYIRQWVLTGKEKVKEVRLFGLSDHFLREHGRLFDGLHRRTAALRWRQWRSRSALEIVAALGSGGAYCYVIVQAAAGRISLGDVLLYSAALSQLEGALSSLIEGVSGLYRSSLFARNLFLFLDMPASQGEAPAAPAPAVHSAPHPVRVGVEFRRVGFSYPGSERPVLEDVSFTIRPGQTVALVGANGAGKTTLVKLLSQLYAPSAGQILVDGVDLRECDVDSWRAQLAVVFQDFVRFNLRAAENVGLGSVDCLSDLSRIRAAAVKGGAHELISSLPQGYDTMLGRRFAQAGQDGVDLSGGQWQKVALARAFMRAPDDSGSGNGAAAQGDRGSQGNGTTLPGARAQLLILDEPTAALDARAEHDLFERFRELTRARMTLLISHRFSTVRMADAIVVLEDGRVTEQGGHDVLLERGGTYARLYRMQAEQYG